MFILFSKFPVEGKLPVNAVYDTEPEYWDRSTQVGVFLEDALYRTTTVATPSGTMLMLRALKQRSGAFSLVDGELDHNDDWEEVQ